MWFESKLLTVFARMGFRNATKFQSCLGCCDYSVFGQTVVGTVISF
jgi:hypothetical protein